MEERKRIMIALFSVLVLLVAVMLAGWGGGINDGLINENSNSWVFSCFVKGHCRRERRWCGIEKRKMTGIEKIYYYYNQYRGS